MIPNYTKYLSGLNRRTKVALQLVLDAASIVLSFLGAMLFRLERTDFLSNPEVWTAIFIALVATLAAFRFFGLYRTLVRYVTGKILIIVGKGAVVAAVALYTAGIAVDSNIPRSVPIIFAVFVFLSVGGVRFIARTYFCNSSRWSKRPVIIYGAGEAGPQLLNSLFDGRDYVPVALIDDDTSLHNLAVGGLSVCAPDQIPRLVRETGAQIILLALPSVSRARRREIVDDLEKLQLKIMTVPTLSEIISGKAKISDLRTVSPEDLLGRDPVAPNPELLGKNIAGRVVMVSGAGGSIGSGICRQILSQQPATLVLFELSEFALYTIEAELSATAKRLLLSCFHRSSPRGVDHLGRTLCNGVSHSVKMSIKPNISYPAARASYPDRYMRYSGLKSN